MSTKRKDRAARRRIRENMAKMKKRRIEFRQELLTRQYQTKPKDRVSAKKYAEALRKYNRHELLFRKF